MVRQGRWCWGSVVVVVGEGGGGGGLVGGGGWVVWVWPLRGLVRHTVTQNFLPRQRQQKIKYFSHNFCSKVLGKG